MLEEPHTGILVEIEFRDKINCEVERENQKPAGWQCLIGPGRDAHENFRPQS